MIASLIEKINAARLWHDSLTDRLWLQPLSGRWYLIVVIIATSVAAYMNYYVRATQYDVWETNPEIFALDDGTQLFTTTDASYFIGLAQSLKRDENFNTFNERRLYPTNKLEMSENPPSSSLRDVPLLSVLISFLAADPSPKSLLKTAHWLLPLTAAITAIFIVIAFGSVGYWLEGAVAAAGGGLSLAYMSRSGAGRIDTDQLNLGFFYLMTAMMIFAARSHSFWTSIVMAGLAGIVMWVFDWWYTKPFFGWAFLIGMVWLSLVIHKDWKRCFLQSALFVLVSGIAWKELGIGESYLSEQLNFGSLIFPNTFSTISELTIFPFSNILSAISGSVGVGLVSALGFLLWAARHPAIAIVFAPAAAFAGLNFIIGSRAIFYSAPVFWFGFAWLVVLVTRMMMARISLNKKFQPVGISLAALASFGVIWWASETDYLSRTSAPKSIMEGFAALDDLKNKDNAVIATWWDYGYASNLLNNVNVLHDGGTQTSPVTHYVARALLASTQAETAAILKFLGRTGRDGVSTHSDSAEAINRAFKGELNRSSQEEVYLVLTSQMTDWIESIAEIGLWNEQEGKPLRIKNIPPGRMPKYRDLKCNTVVGEGIMSCRNRHYDLRHYDLEKGTISGSPALLAITKSENGFQKSSKRFNNPQAFAYMQVATDEGSPPKISLIHQRLFRSTFHQMFHLGQTDNKYFEMFLDGYPHFRVFKIR